jgi:hypothetical protein
LENLNGILRSGRRLELNVQRSRSISEASGGLRTQVLVENEIAGSPPYSIQSGDEHARDAASPAAATTGAHAQVAARILLPTFDQSNWEQEF